MQECHPELSEGSRSGERSFAALRMTPRDGLLFKQTRCAAPGQGDASVPPPCPHRPRPYAHALCAAAPQVVSAETTPERASLAPTIHELGRPIRRIVGATLAVALGLA